MSQNEPLDYGRDSVPRLLSRRRMFGAAIGCAVGAALILLDYVVPVEISWVLYPWPLLSLGLTKDVTESLVLGLSQFPLYGALIGYFWPSGAKARLGIIGTLVLLHILGIMVWHRTHP